MLDLKKFKADIEPVPFDFGKTVTIEFWANDEEEAKEKLDFIVGSSGNKKWNWLEEVDEDV